jgi:hypothetical protein
MMTLALLLALSADETLTKALEKAAALESYAFKGETEFQSQFGNAPATIPSMDGKYQKDVGMHIKSDRGEFFRKGDRFLVKQGSGEWQDINQVQAPAPAEGDKPKRNPARATAMGKIMIRTFKAPHEELKDLAKGFKEVKKAEKTEKVGDVDCTVYSSDLTDEAMKNAPLGRMLGTFGGANATITGSSRVFVDGKGNVVLYEITTKAVLEIQGNQIELGMVRRSEITEAGKTKVEVPEGVQKLLGAPPVKSEDK